MTKKLTTCKHLPECNVINWIKEHTKDLVRQIEQRQTKKIEHWGAFHRGYFHGVTAAKREIYDDLIMLIAEVNEYVLIQRNYEA